MTVFRVVVPTPVLIWTSSSGTFAPETDKVIYGLVFPIKTFEILYVQVSDPSSAVSGSTGRAAHLP